MLRPLFIFFIFSLTSLEAVSQNYITYNTEKGLPSNHIYQVEQDAEGFIWFATNMGVSKFDGKAFKTFTTADGLPTNDVWRLQATEDGKIWFFSKSKKQGYIYKDSVHSYTVYGNESQLPRSFVMEKSSVQFVANLDQKYVHVKLIGNKWTPQGGAVDTKSYAEEFISKSYYITGGRRLVVSSNPIVLYDKNKKFLKRFTTDEATRQNVANTLNIVSKHMHFLDKDLYFILNREFIAVLNLKTGEIYSKRLFPYSDKGDMIFPELQECGDNFQISQANQWIKVDGKLNVLESRTFPISYYPSHIFKDKTGNMWITGHDFGVILYPRLTLENDYFFQGKKIQTINYENGHLFVNVFDEGWYILERGTDKFRLIIPIIGKTYEMGYHEDSKTYYFYNGNTFWYTTDLKKIIEIKTINVQLMYRGNMELAAGAKSMVEMPYGYAFISVSAYQKIDTKFKPIEEDSAHDRYKIAASKVLINFNGQMYIGGDGIRKLQNDSASGKDPLLLSPINTIVQYNENFMLVGTDGFGAYLYDGEKGVYPIRGSENFIIHKFVIDGPHVWMATGKGIHRFTRYSGSYALTESIYDEDGLYENNVNSICKVGNKLYVGQDNGLIVITITPEKYNKKILAYFSQNDYRYNSKDSTYSISYGENASLQFGVLSQPSQKYISYFYKTNKNDQWTPTTTSNLLIANQLPRNYDIYFKGIDQHGNEDEKHITLIVKPLWYQTLLAKIIAGALLFSLVILITLLYRRRIENKKKAELVLSKTMADLELKALRSQMNPHFVFNSLNAIQYYIVKNKAELSEEYLAKFSRLVRLFFEYSKYESLSITQEKDLLNRYLEIEKLRFEDKLEYEINVDEEIDAEETQVPSMILQPIVENAVNHGIFHKKGSGVVKILFKKIDERTIYISVDDDGVGLLAMKEIQKDSYGNYRSKSSEVTKERISILSQNKLSRWKVEYSIKDKSQTDSSLSGTIVEILLKYN